MGMLPGRYVKHSPPKETMNGVANEPKISVQVLVLGDIGRSPRMQYHAMSIAKHGGRVDMIGYQESTLHPGLIDNPLVSIVPLPPPPPILRANKHPFVKVSKYYEALLGSWAPTASFTVTDAMQKQLRKKPYNIKSPIFTLHDRPASIFQPISSAQSRKAFLQRIPETQQYAQDILAGRTKLLVSSTSWTPDEDFNLLLEALCTHASSSENLPPILAIITGKG